jgi:hypothetical protein
MTPSCVPLHIALRKFSKVDKDRVRRKVRKCVETISGEAEAPHIVWHETDTHT